VKYIKDQHSAYLRKELTAMRDRYIQDTRIHCCLYFINPTGHSLRPIDVIVMKKLSEVVNVVPVIAKADSLTLEERESFKQKVSTTSGGVGGGMALMNWRTYRSGQSYSIIASVSIHSTLMSMTKRRCNSTRTFGYVSVVLAVNVL
jgi:Septin